MKKIIFIFIITSCTLGSCSLFNKSYMRNNRTDNRLKYFINHEKLSLMYIHCKYDKEKYYRIQLVIDPNQMFHGANQTFLLAQGKLHRKGLFKDEIIDDLSGNKYLIQKRFLFFPCKINGQKIKLNRFVTHRLDSMSFSICAGTDSALFYIENSVSTDDRSIIKFILGDYYPCNSFLYLPITNVNINPVRYRVELLPDSTYRYYFLYGIKPFSSVNRQELKKIHGSCILNYKEGVPYETLISQGSWTLFGKQLFMKEWNSSNIYKLKVLADTSFCAKGLPGCFKNVMMCKEKPF